LKGEAIPEAKPVKIDVDINAYVPKEFIPDEVERMEIYSAVANIRSDADFERVKKNVEDKYGQVPNSISGLMAVALLKSKCALVKAVRASVNQTQSTIFFDYSKETENILSNIRNSNFALQRKEGTLLFKCDNTKVKKSQIWPNVFEVLDKINSKFVAK
jgi:transcription-repair coupling factor (superfamily II helicase)